MNISFKGSQYNAVVWRPAMGCVGPAFGYDTETTITNDPRTIPEYVVGTVFDGRVVYFVRRQDLGAFWGVHRDCVVYMHTASFDLEVTTHACGFDFQPMVEAGLIRDVSIYYRLLGCATKGDVPHKFNLALMCVELLGVELEKDETVRKDFGRFYHDSVVDYATIPAGYLEYAGLDAIATYLLAERLEAECRSIGVPHTPLPQVGTAGTVGMSALPSRPPDPECRLPNTPTPLPQVGTAGTVGMSAPWGLLGHDIQLRGDIALRAIEHQGVTVDPAAVGALDERLNADIERHRAVLTRYGYVSGKPGNQAVFDQVIRQIETERGIVIVVTPKSNRKSQAADDLAPIADHEFVGAFLGVKVCEKLQSTYIRHLQTPTGRVHPHYTLMLKTGRTSCSTPNVQNLPRNGGIRECIVPSPGHVFVACDYALLELCMLAQITFTRYGHSGMRDLLNQGVDLHRRVAAMILRKPDADVTKLERQKAKAVGFGLPGGMGIGGLQGYARINYGLELSADEGERWRAAWLDLFPEMVRYLDGGDDLQRLGATLDLDAYPDAYSGFESAIAAAIVLRVAGGAAATSAGRSFGPAELEWAWGQIANGRAGSIKAFADAIKARRGSRDLQRAVTPGRVVGIPTGRVRARCSYTETMNWPFQALAADGAKLALYELMRAHHRVVAFIHDEVLVEVEERDDYRTVATDISRIMVEAMQRVCPDVAIRTEYMVMRRWRKDARAVYDTDGRLVAYEDGVG